jgi:hypothetical protein
MRFTARPRMGGRRAVGRRCRGGPRRDRPLTMYGEPAYLIYHLYFCELQCPMYN